jgi:serine/threonine protein phosphatase PrpC
MSAIRHAVLSDKGRRHKNNEDRVYANAEDGLFFVTDGMANEVTPHFIQETLPGLIADRFAGMKDCSDSAQAARMQALLCDFNAQIRSQRLDLLANSSVGATLVLALIRGDKALLAHLGDSRIYRHRAGQFEQLTRDHSVVQQKLDRGEIQPNEAFLARTLSGPTRFLGMPGKALADVSPVNLAAGDRLLLCSDGLPEMLFDDEMLAIFNKCPALDQVCHHLVTAANIAGGHDNISVVIIGVG